MMLLHWVLSLVVFLSLFMLTRQHGVSICDPSKLPAYEMALNITEYTSRGIKDFESNMAPFVDFLKVGKFAKNYTILEIGSGNGRLLMEVQSQLPFAHLWGLNKAGYGWDQLDSSFGDEGQKHLIAVAVHYKIPVICDRLKNPVVPKIKLFDGLQYGRIPLTKEYFDVVISHHSLNEGKLLPYDVRSVAPRVMDALKPGGYASLLLLVNHAARTLFPSLDVKTFTPIAMHTTTVEKTNNKYSVMLYVINENIGMVVKRCSKPTSATSGVVGDGAGGSGDANVPYVYPDGDCIFAGTKKNLWSYTDAKKWADFQAGIASLPHVNNTAPSVPFNHVSNKLLYSQTYLANLVAYLKLWEDSKGVKWLPPQPTYPRPDIGHMPASGFIGTRPEHNYTQTVNVTAEEGKAAAAAALAAATASSGGVVAAAAVGTVRSTGRGYIKLPPTEEAALLAHKPTNSKNTAVIEGEPLASAVPKQQPIVAAATTGASGASGAAATIKNSTSSSSSGVKSSSNSSSSGVVGSSRLRSSLRKETDSKIVAAAAAAATAAAASAPAPAPALKRR